MAKPATTEREDRMQLVQIGTQEPAKAISIREMFEQLAKREEEMIRQGRERLNKPSQTQA
jgi:hypothetical protein